MGFILILLATTLSIAGSAAFFSIYGLAQIFAGSFWPVVVMASSLEAGKLVSASYVYRFWKDISFLMKTYLISAILVLMLITSAGIFGFLSSAYQTDTLSLRDIESQIVLMEEEKAELRERKKQIDDNIASINPNYITKRMELIDKLSPETNRINNRIPVITAEIHKLKSVQITEESHVGPIIYIAKVFERDADDATKWMILLIIFAFDPLAVVLTIATNMAMIKRKEEKIASGEITDFVEIKEVHDQAHTMYDNGTLNKKSLKEFDELTDIVEDFEEPEPLTDEDKEWLNAPPVGKEIIEDEYDHARMSPVKDDPKIVPEPEPELEPEPVVALTKEIEKVAPEEVTEEHIEHAENTLKTLKKTATRRQLTKEEETLKRLLHHMVLHKMPIPTIKGGNDERFITGERK